MSKKWLKRFMGVSMAMSMTLTACTGAKDTGTTTAYNGGAMTAATECTTEAYYDNYYEPAYDDIYEGEEFNTEEYDAVKESGFASVVKSPLSTFGADVDTASYANIRRMINYGYSPDDIPEGAVRTEEMVNYFSYSYNGPKDGEPFGVNAMISTCPWNEENLLLHLGLQTEAVDFSQAGDSNIVFLIDVSGSMDEPNKLPLLQQAFGLLIDELGEKDCVFVSSTDTYSTYRDYADREVVSMLAVQDIIKIIVRDTK